MGNYLKKEASQNLILGVLCLVSLVLLFVTSVAILPFYVDIGAYETARGSAIALFAVGLFYFLVIKYRSYRAGIIGERKVTVTLSQALNDDYSLFNDVTLTSIPYGNIDHIVVGPTGVFVIETKNHKGRISYYGDNWEGIRGQRPSSQVRINAMRVKKILNASESLRSEAYYVHGVVVFVNVHAELIERKPPDHVQILRIDELVSYITSEPRRFMAEEIAQIEMEIQSSIE